MAYLIPSASRTRTFASPIGPRTIERLRTAGLGRLGVSAAQFNPNYVSPWARANPSAIAAGAQQGAPISTGEVALIQRRSTAWLPAQPYGAYTTPSPATSTTTTTPPAPTSHPEPTAAPPIGYQWAQNADGTWYLAPAAAGYPVLPTTPASAVTTGTQSANTGYIVPAGYPTGEPYIDSQGNTWEYNPVTNNWGIVTPGYTNATAAAAQSSQFNASTGVGVPAGTSTASTYTDAAGNVWAYNSSTGQWQIISAAGATSSYQSVLNWLSESTLISGVPNWVMAGGAAAVLLWIANKGKR